MVYKWQELSLNFPGGKNHNYFMIPYEKIGLAHELPGIYSWHIRPISENHMKYYDEFFNQLDLEVKVSGNMRLNYKGKIQKIKGDISTDLDTNLFTDMAISIAYPIYIGISNNVKSRLVNHKKQFEKSLENKDPSNNIKCDNDDTDEESSFFGARLASIWPRQLPKHCLYVKYVIPAICLENKCNNRCAIKECREKVYEQLRHCETISNSLFNPVFGRK